MSENQSANESREVVDGKRDDSQDVFDDDHEESYYVTPEEERQRRNAKILAAVVAVVGLATASAIIWTIGNAFSKDDAHDVTTGETATPEVQLGENNSDSDEEPQETKTDGARRNRIVDSDDGSVTGDPSLAESIERPNGDKAQGNPVIANDDVIIKDEEYVDKIMDTAQRGYDALEGLPVLESDAGNQASDEDRAAVSAVANKYYYSDMRDTAMLSLAREAGWSFDRSKSHVYEGDTNAPLVGMSYVDGSGELMLYMEGYYDPTIDSFKFESFEFTDAARKANSRII